MAPLGRSLERRPALNMFLFLFLLFTSTDGGRAFALASQSSAAASATLESSSIDSSIDSAHLQLQGGSTAAAAGNVADAYISVERYLSSLVEGGDVSSGDFHVHGWRWHSKAFIRDAKRLERLALQLLKLGDNLSEEDGVSLNKAAEHVIDFNLAGLTNVESDVWFPWLREKLCGDKSKVVEDEYRQQLGRMIDAYVDERGNIDRLARAVREQARISSKSPITSQERREAIKNVAEMAAALSSRFQTIFETRAERILVPAVAFVVPERDQRSVSAKVIRKLGVLDSRRHLVGMYDAVMEEGLERELFESEMPSLARAMISRWRRTLYEPAAGMLDVSSKRELRV